MYNSLTRSETDPISILQDLTREKAIDDAEFLPDTESEKRERYCRLAMAVIDTFPNILRDVIRSNISASDLYLRCIRLINTLNPEQQANLRQLHYSNTYSSLDITLIYKLLRQFNLIPPPTQGWGAIPDKADSKLADDIERIRFYRNQIAHRCDTNIDTNVFDDYFDKFQDIARRMDLIFFQKTNYERQIIGHRTRRIDTELQKKYENAMKKIDNIQCKAYFLPLDMTIMSLMQQCYFCIYIFGKRRTITRKQKVRVQIIFQNEEEVERNINILNSLKDEINEGLSGIEFIVATKGSVVLNVEILMEMFETDEKLQTTLDLFLEKILERIATSTIETIDMVLLPVEEFIQWERAKPFEKPVYLDFDIEADLFGTDDRIKEQLRQISDVIFKHSNRRGTNNNITATLLPICLGIENPKLLDCIKLGNTLMFSDCNNRLITCTVNGTDVHYTPLSYSPFYITEIDSDTVAISSDRIILLNSISTGNVTSTIKTSHSGLGISYDDNNLYVLIKRNRIHGMDLAGKVIRHIQLPSDSISNITVHRNRLVCINNTSVYCCLLNGKLMWKFENDKYKSFRRVTTDNERNVYVTDFNTNTTVVVSDDGEHHREILTESDGMKYPFGIHFDKKRKCSPSF
ncbi:unnamed protein product [Mytilus coruscus]|uniref:DZIP3-like HEPN domain-containing protein n=1 Tax=Mytilus coruscus TaxID=42192 RepID=A0A6J8BPN0_MYTCO|nr:unnamed protein product [Mytilus coruscus]